MNEFENKQISPYLMNEFMLNKYIYKKCRFLNSYVRSFFPNTLVLISLQKESWILSQSEVLPPTVSFTVHVCEVSVIEKSALCR